MGIEYGESPLRCLLLFIIALVKASLRNVMLCICERMYAFITTLSC